MNAENAIAFSAEQRRGSRRLYPLALECPDVPGGDVIERYLTGPARFRDEFPDLAEQIESGVEGRRAVEQLANLRDWRVGLAGIGEGWAGSGWPWAKGAWPPDEPSRAGSSVTRRLPKVGEIRCVRGQYRAWDGARLAERICFDPMRVVVIRTEREDDGSLNCEVVPLTPAGPWREPVGGEIGLRTNAGSDFVAHWWLRTWVGFGQLGDAADQLDPDWTRFLEDCVKAAGNDVFMAPTELDAVEGERLRRRTAYINSEPRADSAVREAGDRAARAIRPCFTETNLQSWWAWTAAVLPAAAASSRDARGVLWDSTEAEAAAMTEDQRIAGLREAARRGFLIRIDGTDWSWTPERGRLRGGELCLIVDLENGTVAYQGTVELGEADRVRVTLPEAVARRLAAGEARPCLIVFGTRAIG